MDWKIAAVITMLALGVYNVLVKRFVDKYDWRVMIPIVFVASLALLIYFIISYPSFSNQINSDSISFALLLSVVFAVSTIFTYLSFSWGGQIDRVVPIFNLSVLVSVFILVLMNEEHINLQIALGILLSLAGMALLLY